MKKITEKKIAETIFSSLAAVNSDQERATILSSTVKVITEKKQLAHSEGILLALKELFDKENGIVKAHITIQERLSQEDKKLVQSLVKERYNCKDVILVEKVDQRILGGIKIQVGDEVYDATLKNKLLKLSNALQA